MAEITIAHIRQLALVFGCAASDEEILTFLNENGNAYGMWMRMMQAAEDFIKSNLRTSLTKSDIRQWNQEFIAADARYLQTHPTTPNGISGVNKNLRI